MLKLTPQNSESDDLIQLMPEEDSSESNKNGSNMPSYKIIISDDDQEVHTVTQLVLRHVKFENCPLMFLHAYNESQTKELLISNPDTAILFQDVVMDTKRSGLDLVEFVRNTLNNTKIRIILRTGNPGDAPEERIVIDYDINDYKLKTELTHQKLLTTVYQALRSYRDLTIIEHNRQGLERIVNASSELFQNDNIDTFFDCILRNIISFNFEEPALVIGTDHVKSGFVLIDEASAPTVVAATGRFKHLKGTLITADQELQYIDQEIRSLPQVRGQIYHLQNGFVICQCNDEGLMTYIYIEGAEESFDTQLISLFITNYNLALDRFYLHRKISKVQQNVIYNLSNVIESRSKETARHTIRVSEICDVLFKHLNFSDRKRELLKIATTMHDIGKIGIPDAVLLKPSKLNAEEFTVMKQHPTIGSTILSQAELELFQIANTIAKYHHEKYDGSGYPEGLRGTQIPIEARVLAIVDVFDALTHARPYKEAWTSNDAIEYIKSESGMHFDPALVRLFQENIVEILNISSLYPDD